MKGHAKFNQVTFSEVQVCLPETLLQSSPGREIQRARGTSLKVSTPMTYIQLHDYKKGPKVQTCTTIIDSYNTELDIIHMVRPFCITQKMFSCALLGALSSNSHV